MPRGWANRRATSNDSQVVDIWEALAAVDENRLDGLLGGLLCVEAEADVVAEVLLGHVEDLAALCSLVFHDYAHGRRFRHRVRPRAADLGRCPVGMWQNKDRRDPFDRLEGE